MAITLTMADGQGVGFPASMGTFDQLSALIFENGAIPPGSGIVKGNGNPPAWIEFPATAVSARMRVKQSNVVALIEQ